MKSNPLKPSLALLCKLGSIAVHAEELCERNCCYKTEVDRDALLSVLSDPEVQQWKPYYYCAEEDEDEDDICTCDFDEVENCPVHYPIDDGSEDDDDE